ncbi:hypothetical protein J2T16_003814 [Paenibacillus intestini]|nr:hypothetical protein [Paenibacillus intestini]
MNSYSKVSWICQRMLSGEPLNKNPTGFFVLMPSFSVALLLRSLILAGDKNAWCSGKKDVWLARFPYL